jgi:hypothetical protein
MLGLTRTVSPHKQATAEQETQPHVGAGVGAGVGEAAEVVQDALQPLAVTEPSLVNVICMMPVVDVAVGPDDRLPEIRGRICVLVEQEIVAHE